MASASKTQRSRLCCEMWDDATVHFTIWEYRVFLQILLREFREHECDTETKQYQPIGQIGGVLAGAPYVLKEKENITALIQTSSFELYRLFPNEDSAVGTACHMGQLCPCVSDASGNSLGTLQCLCC